MMPSTHMQWRAGASTPTGLHEETGAPHAGQTLPDGDDPMSAVEMKTRHRGIYKVAGSYVVRFKDRQGRSRRRTFRTEKAAVEFQGTVRGDRAFGADRSVTFTTYSATWLETYTGRTDKGIRDVTMAEYRRVIERQAQPFFGRQRLADITPVDIRRFAARVAARGVSANTIRLHLAPLRLLFKTALIDGVIVRDPCAAVPAPPSKRRGEPEKAKALASAELDALLTAVPADSRLLVEVLAQTGLRISEVLALRWGDIDGDALHVTRRVYRGTVDQPKSRHGRRTVPLAPSVAQALWTARKAARQPQAAALVFPSTTGGYLAANNVRRRILDPAAATAGVPWASFHTLRHTFASRLFAAGWPLTAVSRVLGHRDASFTLRVYVHLMDDALPSIACLDRHPIDTSPAETSRDELSIR
jgi:integrase